MAFCCASLPVARAASGAPSTWLDRARDERSRARRCRRTPPPRRYRRLQDPVSRVAEQTRRSVPPPRRRPGSRRARSADGRLARARRPRPAWRSPAVSGPRAGRATSADTSVTSVPASKATITVRGLIDQPAWPAGRSPSAARPALSTHGQADPAATPAAEATTPMTRDSPRTEAITWRAARADGAKQGQLAQPLGDDDRERVEDDERPDEQGDERERRAGTRRQISAPGGRSPALRGDGLAAHDLDLRVMDGRLDTAHQLGLRDPRRSLHVYLRRPCRAGEHLGGGGRSRTR